MRWRSRYISVEAFRLLSATSLTPDNAYHARHQLVDIHAVAQQDEARVAIPQERNVAGEAERGAALREPLAGSSDLIDLPTQPDARAGIAAFGLQRLRHADWPG